MEIACHTIHVDRAMKTTPFTWCGIELSRTHVFSTLLRFIRLFDLPSMIHVGISHRITGVAALLFWLSPKATPTIIRRQLFTKCFCYDSILDGAFYWLSIRGQSRFIQLMMHVGLQITRHIHGLITSNAYKRSVIDMSS